MRRTFLLSEGFFASVFLLGAGLFIALFFFSWVWALIWLPTLITILVIIGILQSKPASKPFICPYCYTKQKIGDLGFKCSFQLTKAGDKCKNDNEKDKDGWIIKDKYKCLFCTEANLQLFCHLHTDKEIPVELLHMKCLNIALLGAKASGKSNYIGVLIQEALHKMSAPFDCSLSLACSKESKEAYDLYYYKPLYQDGHTVQATQAGIEIPPLIFPIRFLKIKDEKRNSTALTLYDTAGENLDDTKSMNLFNGYISNAQGIILLLDPLQIPDIRNRLTAKGFTQLPVENTEAFDVLDKIVTVIKRNKKSNDMIDIPIALVFTKIDVLQKYDILPAGSCLCEESEHLSKGVFTKNDFENTNIQMEALIDNWVKGALMNYIRQFKSYAFFGVTSLGANPTGNTLSEKVNPRRVLDPLLWLLAKENYIKTRK